MEKTVGLFLGNEEAIARAYTAETRARIAQTAEMIPFVWNGKTDDDVCRAQVAFSTWGMPCLSAAEIRGRLPNLRALFYAAGSVQSFARPFLECGVQVFSARAANALPVAQTVVSEIVLACKGFFQTVHHGGSGVWTKRTHGAPYPGAYGTRIGVLGAGQIGTLVVRRLREMELQPVVYDPYLSAGEAERMGVEKAETVQDVFATCFVISNHMPDLPETRGLLDKTCFARMGKTAVFLNTGRGRQVVESDLIAALRDVPTRVAVLDVTHPEPPEHGSALYTLPNVFLTPHLAGSLGGEVGRMGESMAQEYERLLHGAPLRFAVTSQMLETMA